MRPTRQKSVIRQVLTSNKRPLSADEIRDYAATFIPTLGIATVYREIRRLGDEGELTRIDLPGETPRYELASHGHHHHFKCLGCGKVFDIECSKASLPTSALPKGFTMLSHEVILYGKCDKC